MVDIDHLAHTFMLILMHSHTNLECSVVVLVQLEPLLLSLEEGMFVT